MAALGEDGQLVVAGGGLAGSLMALYLANQGFDVEVLESRPDLRSVDIGAGRSINLALATRGIVALKEVGLFDQVRDILIPMAGRMVHPAGAEANFQPYGTTDEQVIYAVSRSDLNAILLEAAEATGRVRINFNARCRTVDFGARTITFTDGDGFSPYELDAPTGEGSTDGESATNKGQILGHEDDKEHFSISFGTIFACDGSGSAIRKSMMELNGGTSKLQPLDHGYKELTIPAGPDGQFQIEPNALHIWPRSDYMLIALGNPEGDFTVTLFMRNKGAAASFAALETEEQVMAFFEREFSDFVPLVPNLATEFLSNPTGHLGTIYNSGWSLDSRAVLVGDSAHSIVPFHGQGMNLAMESCRLLNGLLIEHPDDIELAFSRYEKSRKPDADAIAAMALENYIEMRSGVVDPDYLKARELALELERRFPDSVAARYGMVMFTTMPYAQVQQRAAKQAAIYADLVRGVDRLEDVDFDRAAEQVANLGPLPTPI